MNNVTRFALQFTDGSFAKNATGRRTHKTAELAQGYADSVVKSCNKRIAQYERDLQRGRVSGEVVAKARFDLFRTRDIYGTARVVPV